MFTSPLFHRVIVFFITFLIGYGGYLFTSPTVSVVMPVYNRESVVGESIESILNQTFTDFEFIIVDDGSTDKTLDVVQMYADQDSRIKVIVHEKNCGVGCGRNTAQRAARGKYLSIMDSDDVAVLTKLETQVQAMEENPDVMALNGLQAYYNAKLPVNNNPKKYSFVNDGRLPARLLFSNCFGNSGAMVRRSFVIKNDIWYDPTLHVGEDYDYWLQIAFAGGRLEKINEYLIHIRQSKGSAMSHPNMFSDTQEVKRRAFERLLGEVPFEIKWAPTEVERCDIWKKILSAPSRGERFDFSRVKAYYEKACAPEIDNKVFVSHSQWNDFLVLEDNNRFWQYQKKEGGRYEMNDKNLLLVWDSYKPERFWLASDSIYYQVDRDAKMMSFKHTFWSDDVFVLQDRLCRLSNKDCANIIHQDRNMITIQWDRFGKERFKRNPKTGIFEHQP